jgi:uncharacterized RDD family membrane protein YckC
MDLKGEPVGEPSSVLAEHQPDFSEEALAVTLSLTLMLAVGASLLVLLRRDPQQMRADLPSNLKIAPLWARVSAGLIDLLPPLALSVVLLGFPPQDLMDVRRLLPQPAWDDLLLRLSTAALLVLHTTILEVRTQASLGKRLLGLSVTDLKGNPPSQTALIQRNAAKVLEVVLPPLLITLLSPQRQRPGDYLAQTLVVMPNEPQQQGESEEEADE